MGGIRTRKSRVSLRSLGYEAEEMTGFAGRSTRPKRFFACDVQPTGPGIQ